MHTSFLRRSRPRARPRPCGGPATPLQVFCTCAAPPSSLSLPFFFSLSLSLSLLSCSFIIFSYLSFSHTPCTHHHRHHLFFFIIIFLLHHILSSTVLFSPTGLLCLSLLRACLLRTNLLGLAAVGSMPCRMAPRVPRRRPPPSRQPSATAGCRIAPGPQNKPPFKFFCDSENSQLQRLARAQQVRAGMAGRARADRRPQRGHAAARRRRRAVRRCGRAAQHA